MCMWKNWQVCRDWNVFGRELCMFVWTEIWDVVGEKKLYGVCLCRERVVVYGRECLDNEWRRDRWVFLFLCVCVRVCAGAGMHVFMCGVWRRCVSVCVYMIWRLRENLNMHVVSVWRD